MLVLACAQVCLSLPDPNKLDLRRDHGAPHPYIVIQTGAACKQCDYRSTSLELVRRHMSKQHRCKSDRKHWLRDDIDTDVRLQSWTTNGARGYWVLQGKASPADELSSPGRSPLRRQRVTAMHEEETRRLAERFHDHSATDTGIDDLALTSNWIRRTGWASTFAGVDRRLLQALSQSPAWNGRHLELGDYGKRTLYSSAEDEKRLLRIGLAVEHFFSRCEDTARQTDHSIRCWLRSHIPGRPYKAPFELPGRSSTTVKYHSLWKSFLYLAIRLYRLDGTSCDDLLRGRLSDRQRNAIGLLWAATYEEPSSPGGAQPNDPWDSSYGCGSETASQVDTEIGVAGNAEEDLSRSASCKRNTMSPSSCDDTTSSDSEYEDSEQSDDSESVSEFDMSSEASPAGQGRGLVSQHRDGNENQGTSIEYIVSIVSYKAKLTLQAHHSSPTTAAEKRLAEAVGKLSLFLCKEQYVDSRSSSTLLVYFSGVLGFSASESNFERPRNYTPKLSGLIYCMRLCMLEATLPRFAHPTNGWQARPRSGNLSRLNRIRERYMCFGCQAPTGELLSLRSYGRAFSRSDGPSFRVNWSEDLETISWTNGKLSMDQLRELGARIYDSAAASMFRLMYGLEPQLQLEDIQDRLSAHEYGYSFVQDPANGLRSEHLKLSSRACLDPIDGLMSGERWNSDAVRRYLAEESNLVLLLFQLLFLRAGQGPRTLELSSIECYNGPSTSRGLYVHDGSMVYITRHAKARQATNQEFQVARYLCREDSMLLARYLVYVRPFTDMLYRKCDGREQDRRLLFAAPDKFDRPWKADVLTRALKTLTRSVCGAAFGVQIYRQISIAITERHIKSICRPFNRYDDKSADADIEVVFAWQSGHRPIQRGTSYGIDAAYPDSLQPALLRVYHWASREWHRFLRIDSAVGFRTSIDGQGSRGPQQLESGTSKRPLHDARSGRAPKRLRSLSQRRSISPPPLQKTYVPQSRGALRSQNPAPVSSLSVLGSVPQATNGISVTSGGAGGYDRAYVRRGGSLIGPAREAFDGCTSSESGDDPQCH